MIKLIDFSSRFRILKGGKVSLVVSALLTSASIVSASPTGGSVTSGTANITQSGNTTNITQSSNKASINWNKFDIAANETVNFNQPNSSSITLNRVIGNEKSVINGALNANGQVWILNSNGVLFGKNASINTSGILATTKELSDTDFQNGNYDFKGNSSESVINLGTIEVSNNGSVVLAANEVVNQGTIKAVRGKVHLVGADEYTVNLNGNSLVNLIVTKGVLDAMVENSGTISANGGEIYLSTNAVNELLKGVVNNTGILEANSFDDLLASTDDIAGKVVLTGDEITNSGTIQAKGKDGGGEILIGGDWQGSNSDKYKQATTVTLTNTSKIDASAIEKGNGGKVVVWSDVKNKDSVTIAKGSIKANAGINSGDGGKVETSGHTLITSGINLDLTAEKGKGGLWLLDPNNITISGSATTAGATPLPNYESSADSSTVLNSDIVSQLNSGTSVTIQTGSGGSQAGDITVASDIITGDMASEATLTLKAHRNIIVNSGVSIDATQNSNTNKLNITLHSDFEGGYIVSSASLTAGAIQVKDGASIKSNGGDIVLGGGANISTGYALATGSLGTGAGIQLSNVVVDSAGGDITMRGMGQHALGSSTGVILESGTSISSGLGKINITGRSEAFLNSTSGLRNGIRIDNASITSTSTADDAITLSGLEGYGAGSASGGTGSNREGISLTNTNITSAGGVTFAADKQIYNNSTLTTSGSKDSLSITSYENNAFWDAFNWNGTLSGSKFVGSESILGLTINDMANLNGLTIGKATNTSLINLNNNINIAGDINIYGKDIWIRNGSDITTSNGGNILLKSSSFIAATANSDITTDGGDIILWSNSNNTTSGTANNEVTFSGTNILTSNGGNIVLAGGLDDGSNGGIANDGTPDGYAYRGGITGAATNIGANSSLLSNGGDIILRGQQNASDYAVSFASGLVINSGIGTISIDGQSNGNHAIALTNGNFAITSASTAETAINIVGTTTSTFAGIVANFNPGSGNSLIQTTGTSGGGIVFKGINGGSGTGLWLGNNDSSSVMQILSNTGDISLITNGTIAYNDQTLYLGNRKNATAVQGITPFATNASGDITIQANALSFTDVYNTYVDTTGSFTVTPFANAFTSPFVWAGALNGTTFQTGTAGTLKNFYFTNFANLGGLTIGKATSTTNSSVVLNSDISIKGPISVYADNIDMNNNITIANADENILMKASGYIFLKNGFDLTTNSGDIILWSNLVNEETLAGAENSIDIRGNNDFTTNGGKIVLAGGADTNNDGIPDGYAFRGINDDTYLGVDLKGGVILDSSSATNGGDIIIRGSGYGEGVKSVGTLKIDSGTGTITIDGKSTQDNGVEFNGDAIAITTENTTSNAIKITGTTTGTGKYGVVLGSGGTASGNTLIQATGANGGITISGTSANSIGLYGREKGTLQILAQSGDITLKGQNLAGSTGETDADFRNGVGENNILFYLGNRKEATTVNGVTSSITNSSSDIKLQADFLSWGTNEPVINTTGAFTLESVSDSFSTLQDVRTSWFTFTKIGGLNIGKSTNVQNVTINEALNVAGDVNIFGKNIAINANINTSSASDGDILLKASGNIIQDSGKSVITNGGDIIYWSNSDNGTNSDGSILLLRDSSITTSGGNFWIGGGSGTTTWNGLTVGDGYALASVTTDPNHRYSISPVFEFITAVYLEDTQINTNGGNISIYGKTDESSRYALITFATNNIDSGSGKIYVDAIAEGTADRAGVFGMHGTMITSDTTFTSTNSDVNAISLNFDTTSGTQYGSVILGKLNIISDTGGINYNTFGKSGYAGLRLGYLNNGDGELNMLSNSGDITFNSGMYGVKIEPGNGNSSINFGRKASTSVTTSSSDVTFISDKTISGSIIFNTSGAVAIKPTDTNSFTSEFDTSDIIYSSDVSKLTIGHSDNTANIIVGSDTIIAGDIKLYGGDITIKNKLEATNSKITLDGSGTITDGTSGYVVADSLLLLDGAVTLDNALNDINTLSAKGIDSLVFIDKDDLELGTVDSTDGVTSTGIINIATLTGNLKVSKNISGTAITLNAGKDTAAGTSTGGNIIISGTPTITASTGNAKLYTGSISGSTGLTSFIGSGSAKFRYNSDENSNGFNTALGTTGNYAIYREKPILSGTIEDKTITYADSNPTFTASNGTIVNGDTLTLVSPIYSTATKLKAGTYTMNASELGDLGYDISGITQTGTLTVNKKVLTVAGITAQDKEYNANNTATLSNAGTLNGLITNDLVTFTTASTFNNKNVEATKTLDLDYTLAGTDKDNYSLTDLTAQATSAKITAKELTLSASKTYDGTTSLTGNVTLAGYVGTETLTYTNATVNDAHVATASKYINAITLADGTNGGIATNYKLPTLNNTNAAVTINAKTLTSTITNTGLTKTYDGTTNAPSSFAPTYSFTGLVSGDTNAILAYTSANYNDKDVLDATKITLAGLSINSITGTNSSNISDYILDSNTKDVSASITKANLTVNANNDARFVTQTDNSGFAGASYTGFVAAESSTDIAGSLAITRIDANTNTIAGTYTNKLVASGLTSDNYSFNYVNGDYTIVGANQLLVKVANENNTYGTNTIYNIASAEYLASDNSTIVDLTSNITNSGNTKTIIDGASGSATFTIAPENLSTSKSTANKLNVGSYQLETSGIVSENSANFSNVVTLVGSHQVNTKAISANATNVSKVYDGTTSMNEVSLGLDTLETSDVVTVNGLGAFSSKNAGNSLDYTISNLALSGTDSSNYYLIAGTSLSGNDGTINKKALTISYDANDKVYDGNTTVVVNKTLTGKISGDDISVTQNAAFADKNVDTNKTVNVSSIALNGVDKNNYTLASTLTTTADITRLNSVTWIGGNTGNWFDPSNWAGGAIPDLSNVANVVIPTGVVVTFDTNGVVSPADISAVNIDSLGTLGSLTMANGELNIKNSMTLDTFTQNGGILTAGTILTKTYNQTAGSSTSGSLTTDTLTQSGGTTTTDALTVNNSFTQSGTTGQIKVNNNANITQTSGNMQIGNLSVGGDLTANANSGDILQVNGTTIDVSGLTTLNTTGDITLNSNTNDFNKLSLNANNATIVDGIGGIVLSDIRTAGNLNIKSLGGDITQTSTSKLNIGNQSTFDSTSNYDVILKNYSNIFTGMINVTANSAIIWSNTKPTWGIINTKTPIVYSGPHDKDIISAQNLITPIANATSVRINENMNLNIGLNNNLSKSNSIIHMESKPTKKVSHDELKTIQEREDTKITLSTISNVNIIGTGVNLPLGLSQEFYLSEDNLKEGI